MFAEYTPEELAVFDKTIRKIDQIDNAIVEHLRLHPWPDDEKADFWHDETLTDEEKRELHHKQHERLLTQWKDTAPPGWLEEWEKLQQERSYLIELQRQEYSAIFKAAEDRAFKEIGTDPAALMKSAKDYVARKVEVLIQEADPRTSMRERARFKNIENLMSFSTHYILATDDGDWKLDADVVEELINQGLRRHYKLLADQRDLTGRMFADILREYITNYLDNHSKVLRLPPGTAEEDRHRLVELRGPQELEIIRTAYPMRHMFPTNKETRVTFDGQLTNMNKELKAEERGRKKEITTYAKIDFPEDQLKSLKDFDGYDRAVYSAIITLRINGNNEYQTPQMIYQVMTGNPDAYLTPAHSKRIRDGITKFMVSIGDFDLTEEAKMRGWSDLAKYKTNLLNIGILERQNLNGTVVDWCIRLLDLPVLYTIANRKDQIIRMPIAALNTPVNKNEDTIKLQCYLMDRVAGMKSKNPTDKRIPYSSMYNALWGGNAKSTSSMKKKRVREYAAKILQHWCKAVSEHFIKSFEEYTAAGGKRPLGIKVDP
mgnify:CR=1 FL=1